MNTFTPECVRKVDFQADAELVSLLKKQWEEYAQNIHPYPGNYNGKGIVICAGGVTYLTCAWINITLLRKNGCKLPIEIWYSGHELSEEVIEVLEKMDAKCRNCKDYTKLNVQNIALKPFAILHSEFKEVLFLDADNNPVVDPTYLFDSTEYQTSGAVFWPDFWITDKSNPIWEIVGSDDFDSVEQESGQILIHKEKCWRELNLCMYFNLNREYYYKMLMGDKDTFKFAWMALGSPYYMISTPVGFCGFNEPGSGFHGLTMVQHDFDGNIIFLHRNWFKWDVTKNDEPVWMEIKRFKEGSKNKMFTFKEIVRDNFKFELWDILGDVESVSFQELFGDFELTCLEILKDLRSADFYARFLLHIYFVHFRPGYSKGYTGKIFQAQSNASSVEKALSSL